MNTKTALYILFLTFFTILLAGCGLLPAAESQVDADEFATQVAERVNAQLTQQAFESLVVQLTQVATMPTATPTWTQLPPSEVPPTATSWPTTTTSLPPTTSPPTATPIPAICDHAQFVKDVSVPDGTMFGPNADFTKVWRLKNIGTCTWSSGYSLVFTEGDRMEASRSIPIGETVYPGESVDVAAEMTAPDKAGHYRGSWMLVNTAGTRFGIGGRADNAFWVDIKVLSANSHYGYDFAANICSATWASSAGSLSCPSPTDSKDGSIALLNRPILENERHEDELTLWTRPENTEGGWISGTFPSYKVKANDHFLADVGCLIDNPGCEVSFFLEYQEGGKVKTLGEWGERYDGYITRIDYDLSALAGKDVKFVLTVYNDGKASKANAFWLVPSIRNSPPPTPTSTTAPPTATTAPPTPTTTATQVPPTPTSTLDLNSIPAAQAARQRLAQDLGADIGSVMITRVEAVVWNDSCLGVNLPDLVCSEVLVDGYKVSIQVNEKHYEAHTNGDGSIVYWFEL